MTGVIRFLRVQDGDRVDLKDIGFFGVSGTHKYLGFKPDPKGVGGWLVLLVQGGYERPSVTKRRG